MAKKQKTKEIFNEDKHHVFKALELPYVLLFMEAIEQAGIKLGMPESVSRLIALQITRDASLRALRSKKSFKELQDEVTSPGGTTEAALKVLHDGGFKELIADAVKAAYERSKEI